MSTPLGDLIRHKRKDKGWTQTQLAERLSVQQVTVSEWETGKNQPRDITAVTTILGITHDEFMAAVAAMVYDDPVVIHLSATTAVGAEVRDALLTLYREAVQAHRTKNNEQKEGRR